MKTTAILFCLLIGSALLVHAANLAPPPGLMEAIARQESDMNPLAVNVAGKDYYPATREEAIQIIRQAQAAGKSYDVGLHQINRYWIDKYSISPERSLDPEINRQWATAILEDEITRHGLNWKAIGKYHSPDIERGRRYAWLIYRHYTRQAAKAGGYGK
ncbi:MAG: putative type IV secretion system component virB1 [Candidatus Desulfovibrio kirbyi]|uniref:Putative type IV secretion system component virB1 n=1 Tax=Candidatus Desulfovibrio kirbyi TaxID=2696086 RepID=A0A6L2R7F6_9BACT|nr:MAG: putative type IV secretion system component virB1 [Candidatus Desulfovibrio kirbyi]